MNVNLLVIVILFFLSLTGAYVLFRFLESSAVINDKRYKAGGAIAGFILIYGILFGGYFKLEANKIQKIEGTITPNQQFSKIVLAIKQTDPDMHGKFRLSANCIDLDKDDVKIYVITGNGQAISKQIFKEEDMENVKIQTAEINQ